MLEDKLGMLSNIASKYNIPKEKLISDYLSSSPVGSNLHYCIVYLAPNNYHRVHSPAEWTVDVRKHFPGTLFPVHDVIIGMVPSLLATNERVVLSGKWDYGYFSLSAVGAYNVGSILLTNEPEFKTNLISRDFASGTLKYTNQKNIGSMFSSLFLSI